MHPDSINEKRQDLVHLRKIVESGISFSAHSIHGWIDQFERMQRFKARALRASNETDSLDFSLAFFQSCYHLKDWIPVFENIPTNEWNRIWEDFIIKNVEIKYCRDLCNGTKHLDVKNPSIDPKFSISRKFEEDGTDEGKFLGWILNAGGNSIDLFELMDICEFKITTLIIETLKQ